MLKEFLDTNGELKITNKRFLDPNPYITKAKKDFCEQSGYADQQSACEYCSVNKTCDGPQLKLKEIDECESLLMY